MPEGNHKTRPVLVWADVDIGIAEMVVYLNGIPGVRTLSSCQGTIDGDLDKEVLEITEEFRQATGRNPYRPQVMCTWTDDAFKKLNREFDITILGDHWGYIHPIGSGKRRVRAE